MIFPYIPDTSEKLFDQLGLSADYIKKVTLRDLAWAEECREFQVKKKDPLFPSLEKR